MCGGDRGACVIFTNIKGGGKFKCLARGERELGKELKYSAVTGEIYSKISFYYRYDVGNWEQVSREWRARF